MSTRSEALKSYESHVVFRKLLARLSAEDKKSIETFIQKNDHLPHLEFEYLVNRMHLNMDRPKNWSIIQELLVSANTNAHGVVRSYDVKRASKNQNILNAKELSELMPEIEKLIEEGKEFTFSTFAVDCVSFKGDFTNLTLKNATYVGWPVADLDHTPGMICLESCFGNGEEDQLITSHVIIHCS